MIYYLYTYLTLKRITNQAPVVEIKHNYPEQVDVSVTSSTQDPDYRVLETPNPLQVAQRGFRKHKPNSQYQMVTLDQSTHQLEISTHNDAIQEDDDVESNENSNNFQQEFPVLHFSADV